MPIEGLDVALESLTSKNVLYSYDFPKAAQAAIDVIAAAIVERTPVKEGSLALAIETNIEILPNLVIATCGFSGFQGLKALWIEYGHRIIAHGVEAGVAPPHPFIRPAWDASYRPAMAVFAEVVAASAEYADPFLRS